MTITGAKAKDAAQEKLEMKEQETVMDAFGNVSKVKTKKKLSKREEKAMIKALKAKIANNENMDTDEEEFATENGLFA